MASAIMKSKAYGEYVLFRNGYVPPVDREILLALPKYNIRLTQGGLSRAVKASASTHAGLGAFDVNIRGLTKAQVWELCSMGLRSGQIWFPRGFTWDTFQGKSLSNLMDGNEHVHVCSRESFKQLHPSAQNQINEYLRSGGDGLVGSAGYTGPHTKSERWATSPYNPRNIKDEQGMAVVLRNDLIGNSVDRNKREVRDKGYEFKYVQIVRRWGRWNFVNEKGRYFAVQVDGVEYSKKIDVKVEPTPKPDPVEPKPPLEPVAPLPVVTDPVVTYTQN